MSHTLPNNAVCEAKQDDSSRLSLLYEVAEQINSTLDLDECLDRIIAGAYRIFLAEKLSLMLLDETTNEMRISAARNIPENVIAETFIRPGEGLAGKVALSGEPLIVTDTEEDPRLQRKSKQQYQSESFAILPLCHKDRVLGVINLTNRTDGAAFSDADLALLKALANQAAIAIQNSRLVAQLNREKEQLRRGAFESNILYQVSSAIRYGLGYQHLIKLLFASLDQLLDYDILCSLLILKGDEHFEVRTRRAVSEKQTACVKRDMLDHLAALPHSPIVAARLAELREALPVVDCRTPHGSTINVPLSVGGEAIGILCVRSERDDGFSEEDTRLLHNIVQRMAETVERLSSTIRGEQDKMQSMVASMTEGVVMFDVHDELVVLNPKARSVLGLARNEEFTTQSFFKSILWREIAEFLAQEVDGGSQQEFTIDSHPEPRVLNIALTPVTNELGEPLGRLAIIRDVTRERELDRMKSDFVAVVSHELRTPLTSINSFIGNLMDGIEGEVTDGQRECLLRMSKNVDRLSRLINDLLDLSKLEAGKMQLQLAPLSIHDVLESISAVFEPTADTKDISLNIDIPEDLPVSWADADRLEQVLTNLLSNALKFTPAGGHICTCIRHQLPEPSELIGPTPIRSPISGEGKLVISVRDTGPGLPDDDLEQVFDKFYQADHSMTRKTGGTGLGLPICKEIVTQHGGDIWAESEPGQGATFTFTLPVDGRAHDRALLAAALEREIRRSRRYQTPFSALMLDIDDFTEVNHDYGYPAGDVALRTLEEMVNEEVKRFLSEQIRESDDFGRFGGDEFLIIAPETDETGARGFAERIRALVEQRVFTVEGVDIRATISVGITSFRDEDLAPISIIRRAAAALAGAKAAGKNQVCTHNGYEKEATDGAENPDR